MSMLEQTLRNTCLKKDTKTLMQNVQIYEEDLEREVFRQKLLHTNFFHVSFCNCAREWQNFHKMHFFQMHFTRARLGPEI